MPSAVLGSPKDQFPIISKKSDGAHRPLRLCLRSDALLDIGHPFSARMLFAEQIWCQGLHSGGSKRTVGSVSLGTSEDDGIMACPLPLKNSKNFFLISVERMSQREESNLQPSLYKSAALPLSYSGLSSFLSLESAPPT